MKKMIAGLMALAVVAGVAQAEETLSRNAVGFVKVIIEPGALAPVVYPFDILGSDVTEGIKFTEMQIAQELPGQSKVYFWNGTGWIPSTKNASAGWLGEARNKVVADGEMFFIEPAATATGNEYTLSGEVPSAAKVTRAISSGPNLLNVVGYAYPTAKKFTETDIAIKAPGQSKVYFWNGAGWIPSTKNASAGWLGEARNKELAAGEGFFIEFPDASVESWVEEKPYTWP